MRGSSIESGGPVRILIVVNLRSGQGDAGLYEYVRELGKTGSELTMRFLGPESDLPHALRDAADYDRIVAAGGDGTVSGVCHKVAGSGVPVLPYPAGTANLFALNMRLPADPHELARLTVAGNVRDVDLGEITYGAGDRRGFVVAAGAGFDANIMKSADRLKSTLGTAAYLVGALQNLTPKVARFKLTIDGESIESEGIAALVMNVARIQFDLALTHTSDPSDGILEVVIVRTRNVPGLIPTVWGAFLDRFVQKPGHAAGLEVHSGRDIVIEAEPALALQYDGEVLPATTPLAVRILPGATRVVVPDDY
jgi:diacylglycerol kinase family enzyme